MKQFFLLAVMLVALPFNLKAQDDDLYFSPKKKVQEQQTSSTQRSTYYVGSNRDVDEYNRRGKYWSHYQKLGSDEQGNDIIQFQKGNGVYPDSVYVDTTFVGKYVDMVDADDDYVCSRRLSRWDGYYDPWLYSARWHSPYYWYGGWYDPWYAGGWYDPWYAGYYGWGYPYYYNPYYYAGWGRPYYYGGWGWPGYWGGVYVAHYRPTEGYAGHRTWGGARRGNAGYAVSGRDARSFGGRTQTTDSRWRTNNDNRSFGTRVNTNRQNTSSFGSRPSMPSTSGGSFGGGSRSGGFGGGHSMGGGGGRFGGGHR